MAVTLYVRLHESLENRIISVSQSQEESRVRIENLGSKVAAMEERIGKTEASYSNLESKSRALGLYICQALCKAPRFRLQGPNCLDHKGLVSFKCDLVE